MTLDVTVRVGGVTFRSREPEGQIVDGFYLDDLGFDGWNDGTDTRRDEVERPNAHGSFDLPGFLTPRVVTLSGSCWASTPEQLLFFRSQLIGLLADGQSGRIFVDQPGETQWADARLAAAARTTFAVRAEDIRSATFEIMFWCANPRKYGGTRTFPNADYTLSEVHHRGNFPAIPIHTVTGTNATGYTINGPGGRKFTVAKAVVAGSPHVIDMSTGWLTINGVVQTGAVTVADLWSIPGGVQVAHSITGAGLTLTTTVKDTYI